MCHRTTESLYVAENEYTRAGCTEEASLNIHAALREMREGHVCSHFHLTQFIFFSPKSRASYTQTTHVALYGESNRQITKYPELIKHIKKIFLFHAELDSFCKVRLLLYA